MARWKFEIKRKSDNKITHCVLGDKDGGGRRLYDRNGGQTLAVHSAWGAPPSYDIVETDITDIVDFNEKKSRFERAVSGHQAELLIAVVEHLAGDPTKFDAMLSKFNQLKAANPIPTRPAGA